MFFVNLNIKTILCPPISILSIMEENVFGTYFLKIKHFYIYVESGGSTLNYSLSHCASNK